MTVHPLSLFAASHTACGFANTSLADVRATNAMFGRKFLRLILILASPFTTKARMLPKFLAKICFPFILLSLPPVALAQFLGDLVLTPAGCESAGQCTLKNKLLFTDPTGIVWEAKAGLITDGASIPGIFQPFIGEPFDPAFIRAAVVHDHYCDRHVRPWRQTHRVFYEGLVAQGVSSAKAKAMYFAVVLGGPKWVELIPGVKCGKKNCINNIKTVAGKPGYMMRKADYSAKDVEPAVAKLAAELAANPTTLTLDQIDQRAASLRPTDFYFLNDAQYKVDNPDSIQ
jgi:Protein of unknown function (DUF1353)